MAILTFMAAFTIDDVKAVRKPRDSWWTVFLVDPVACRLTLLLANHTTITPNGVTRLSILLGLASAACFGAGWLAAGAALFYLSFLVDCVDGKLARLKGNGTPFGLWLDYVGDRLRVACCAAGLGYGQYAATGEAAYLLMGGAVIVLDLFRYINGPQLKRVREASRQQARAAAEARWSAECVFVEDILSRAPQTGVRDLLAGGTLPSGLVPRPTRPGDGGPGDRSDGTRDPRGDRATGAGPERADAEPAECGEPAGSVTVRRIRPGATPPDGRPLIDLYARFRARFPWYDRVRRALARHRVRTHVVSGIEYHALVFVIAPLIGPAALLPAVVAGSLLLLLFEAVLVYRMWLVSRELANVTAAPYPTHVITGLPSGEGPDAGARTAQRRVADHREGVCA
ncbi:hypothetical protein GCM10010106_48620 [Thermopolyspora flexuosa]|nr:hypothetical protein GCM10010106_48620 [Thermopolyspora flexuosa]